MAARLILPIVIALWSLSTAGFAAAAEGASEIRSPAAARETDPEALVLQGNKLYQRGDFASAAAVYLEALSAGLDNGHIHYNLANAYYREQRYGRAIAHYRRALLQLPGDPDVLANLKLAREKASGAVSAPAHGLLDFSWLLLPRQYFTEFQMKVGFLTLFFLCCAAWALRPLLAGDRGRYWAWSFCLAGAYWGLLTFAARPAYPDGFRLALTPGAFAAHPAVVVSEEANVRSGNGRNFQVVAVLKEGAEITIAHAEEDRKNGNEQWIEVHLPEGRRGWTEAENLEIL